MTVSKLYLIYLPVLLLCGPVFGQKKYDVIVYGSGSGGFTAAIQVAKMGKSVALLEPYGHVGGMNTEGLGGTDVDNHQEFANNTGVGGLAMEFYERISKAYHRDSLFKIVVQQHKKDPAVWRFESSVAEKVITEWLQEYSIDVYYHCRLAENKMAVQKKSGRITSVLMENGQLFSGKVFIDATIEGDLLAAAGISFTTGREANSLYGETKNGIRAETDHAQFTVNVDPYKIPGNKKSGLLPGVQAESLGIPGEGDDRLQAYCFRVCLTRDTTNMIPFYKPQGYDTAMYELYIRFENSGGILYKPNVSIPNGKTDLGAWHDLSHNLYGMNRGYPIASYAARQKILSDHTRFTQGLFYFLANDPRVSAATRNAWSNWGYAKNEFTDNRGFPRMFYVRDGRRMVSDFVMTEKHVRIVKRSLVPDPVAVAYWPPDLHSVRRIVKDGYAYNEGAVFGGNDWQPFSVAYRALVPRKKECSNLLTSTCPSASHVAYGAIRIEFTFMALGQVCGAAAVQAINNNTPVQDVGYDLLKMQLLKDKQVIKIAGF